MEDFSEKTEAPTPHRRRKEREDGNVAKSTDLTAAVALLMAVLLLGWFGAHLLSGLKFIMQTLISGAFDDPVSTGGLAKTWKMTMIAGAKVLAPVVLGVFGIALVAGVMQVGFLVTLKPLQPKFSRLSPLKGFKQIFSKRGAMRLVMSLGKVAIVAAVATLTIWQELPQVVRLPDLDAMVSFAAAAEIVYVLCLRVAITLIILAILDFMYQKWQHSQDLMMSKDEVKREFKQMDGDPLVKQRRAEIARQLAMQRMAQAVPKADVVVTNPTHFAVALQYDGSAMAAPKVVAKGADFLALRIRQIAVANGIPIVERKALARTLYRTVEVGQEIPADHYAAVAEILAYVYRLSGKQIA